MKIELKTITPELAQKWLSKNSHNRSKDPTIVKSYAQQMKKGQWYEGMPDSPIALSSGGELQNGQHRLFAILECGMTIKMWVAFDVPESAFKYFDQGKKRTLHDVFAINKVKNGNWISTGIKAFLILKEGKYALTGGVNSRLISVDDVENEYNIRPDYWQGVAAKSQKWYIDFKKTLNPQFIFSYYVLLSEISFSHAEDFMTKLSTGLGLMDSTDPIYMLRKKLLDDKDNGQNKLNESIRSALFIKAWNYYRQNKKMKILKFDSERDGFPKPI